MKNSNQRLTSTLKSFSRLSGIIIVLAAASVMLGWTFDIPALKSISPRFVTMKFNTAFALLLIGWSIILSQKKLTLVARAFAYAVAAIGLLTLIEYIFGIDLRIDQLIFKEPATAVETYLPGRMSPATALTFFLLGAGLVLVDFKNRVVRFFADLLIVIPAAVSFLAILGYFYGVKQLYAIHIYTSMAIHTAILFFVACVAILSMRPEEGVMGDVTYDSPAASLGRRILAVVVFLLPVLGYFRILGQQKGLYGSEFGTALSVAVAVFLFSAFILVVLHAHHKEDTAFKEAEDRIHLLSRAVDQSTSIVMVTDAKGYIEYVNPKFTQVTGYTISEVEGRNPRLLKSGEQPLGFYKTMWETVLSGREWHGEFRNKKKNGECFWIFCTMSAVKDSHGAITHFLAVQQDITKQKESEDKLKTYTDELERMNKLMVGREVKMVELKEEIERLKKNTGEP